MKATVWTLLALLAAVMLLAACPRTDGEGNGTTVAGANGTNQPTSANANSNTPDVNTPLDEKPATDAGQLMNKERNGKMEAVFQTTKGEFTIAIHPEWSPIGAKHFLKLVESGFYDGAPWFRVIDGFVAQCGVSASPEMNKEWAIQTIQDEPVVQGNQRGFVAFGQSSAPNSRSTHFFINFADNSAMLDSQGFACFAEVVDGMDVVDSLARVEYSDQAGLAAPGGLEKFKTQFPNADYIIAVKVIRPEMQPVEVAGSDDAVAPPAEEAPAKPEEEGGM